MSDPVSPFALFVVDAKSNDLDYINDVLKRAWKGSDEGPWELYLATNKYEDAPKVRADGRLSQGTRAPVSDFKYPFAGNSIEQCLEWLQAAPEDIALNRRHFTALSTHSKEDDTVLICRTNQKSELQYFPYRTDLAAMVSKMAVGTKFDEYLQNYQRQRMQDGKPDRSRGEPYSGVSGN